MEKTRSRDVFIDGIRTHYWEAGDGPTLVLLHAGGFGENAERSWHRNISTLATRYRVIAPDWIGFGGTEKIRDFSRGNTRLVDHLVRFLDLMAINDADFAGLSMGGTLLMKAVAEETHRLPVRRLVLVSCGGFSPLNDARRILQEYDGTIEAMREQLRQVIHAPMWESDEFVRPYWEASLERGQWEFISAARLRAPFAPLRGDFGNLDDTPYERIGIPTLLTAGAQDRLREPGYADEVGRRIPRCDVIVYDPCGHCPNVERAEEWNADVLSWLERTKVGS